MKSEYEYTSQRMEGEFMGTNIQQKITDSSFETPAPFQTPSAHILDTGGLPGNSTNNMGMELRSFNAEFDDNTPQNTIDVSSNLPKLEGVNVHVRLRPYLQDESQNHKIIERFNPKKGEIIIRKDFEKKYFQFDDIHQPGIAEEEVYERVGKDVVNSVLDGFNGCIMAYGQTGTGKTFTMIGDLSNELDFGIIPRALRHIFHRVREDSQNVYEISLSFIQIYMENITDLLDPQNKHIRIREDPNTGVFVSNISWVPVGDVDQSINLFITGYKNRVTATTNLNAHSSRSHAVLMLKIEKRKYFTSTQIEEMEKDPEAIHLDMSMTSSTLYLVDLAGSERVKKTKATASRLDEAKKINFSLLALGNCIEALTEERIRHIPFRDSKLTRLLQDSFGGNSKTHLLITIGPSNRHVEETISSLIFGLRAMKVQNKPTVNKQLDYKAAYLQLQAETDLKNEQIYQLNIKNSTLSNQLLKRENDLLGINNPKIKGKGLLENQLELIEKQKMREIEEIKMVHKSKMVGMENEHKNFLEEIDKIITEQEETVDELKKDNNELSKQNDGLKELTQTIEGKYEKLKKDYYVIKQDNDKYLNEIQELTEENQFLKSKSEYLQGEVGKLKTVGEENEQRFGNKISELELKIKEITLEYQTKIEKLEKDLEESEKETISQQQRNLAQISKYKNQELYMKKREAEFSNSESEKQEMGLKLQELNDELNEIKGKNIQLQDNLDESLINIKKLIDQINIKNAKVVCLKERVGILESENENEQIIIQQTEENHQIMVNNLNSENGSLKLEIENNLQEITTFSNKVTIKEKEVTILKTELDTNNQQKLLLIEEQQKVLDKYTREIKILKGNHDTEIMKLEEKYFIEKNDLQTSSNAEIDNLNCKILEYETEVANKDSEISSLNMKYNNYEDQAISDTNYSHNIITELTQELNLKTLETNETIIKIENSNKIIKEQENTIHEKSLNIEELQLNIQNRDILVMENNQRIDNLNKKMQELGEEKCKLIEYSKSEIENVEIQRREEELAYKENMVQISNKYKAQITEKNMEISTQKTELEDIKLEKEGIIENINREIAEISHEKAAVLEDCDILNTRIRVLEGVVDSQKECILDKDTKLNRFSQDISANENKLHIKREMIKDLQFKLSTLVGKYEELYKIYKDHSGGMTSYLIETLILKTQNTQLIADLQELRQKYDLDIENLNKYVNKTRELVDGVNNNGRIEGETTMMQKMLLERALNRVKIINPGVTKDKEFTNYSGCILEYYERFLQNRGENRDNIKIEQSEIFPTLESPNKKNAANSPSKRLKESERNSVLQEKTNTKRIPKPPMSRRTSIEPRNNRFKENQNNSHILQNNKNKLQNYYSSTKPQGAEQLSTKFPAIPIYSPTFSTERFTSGNILDSIPSDEEFISCDKEFIIGSPICSGIKSSICRSRARNIEKENTPVLEFADLVKSSLSDLDLSPGRGGGNYNGEKWNNTNRTNIQIISHKRPPLPAPHVVHNIVQKTLLDIIFILEIEEKIVDEMEANKREMDIQNTPFKEMVIQSRPSLHSIIRPKEQHIQYNLTTSYNQGIVSFSNIIKMELKNQYFREQLKGRVGQVTFLGRAASEMDFKNLVYSQDKMSLSHNVDNMMDSLEFINQKMNDINNHRNINEQILQNSFEFIVILLYKLFSLNQEKQILQISNSHRGNLCGTLLSIAAFKQIQLGVKKSKNSVLKLRLNQSKSNTADILRNQREFYAQNESATCIQKHWKRKKQTIQTKKASIAELKFMRERENAKNVIKVLDTYNAKTGKYLLADSLAQSHNFFTNLEEIFVTAQSSKYEKFNSTIRDISKSPKRIYDLNSSFR